MSKNQKELNLDILEHLENLSSSVNEAMKPRTRTVFRRYPITFGLLILLGVISLHEGIKGIVKEFGLLNINPWYLLIFGLVVLIATGSLYKKLDK